MQHSFIALCASLAAGAAAFAWFAAAPTQDAEAAECARHEIVTQFLGTRYKEARKAMGVVSSRGIMELFVSNESGTWTVLVTMPNGVSCIVAAGDSFEDVPQTVSNDPAA